MLIKLLLVMTRIGLVNHMIDQLSVLEEFIGLLNDLREHIKESVSDL